MDKGTCISHVFLYLNSIKMVLQKVLTKNKILLYDVSK